jgi:phage host-nuclease inhibitor protein Gam
MAVLLGWLFIPVVPSSSRVKEFMKKMSWLFYPWRMRHYCPSKHQESLTQQQNTTSQNISQGCFQWKQTPCSSPSAEATGPCTIFHFNNMHPCMPRHCKWLFFLQTF